MNRTIHTFFIITTLLANSGSLFGMQRYSFTGTKPSLNLPTGIWEDADREEVAKQIALEREEKSALAQQKAFALASQAALAKPTITITNSGKIPFIAQTDDWKCTIAAHSTSPTKSCAAETFLEILVNRENEIKIGRCLVKDALGLSDIVTPTKNLAIKIFSSQENDIFAVLNNTLAIPLEDMSPTLAPSSKNNWLDNESDTTENISLSIDSPVVSPHAKSEHYQGDI